MANQSRNRIFQNTFAVKGNTVHELQENLKQQTRNKIIFNDHVSKFLLMKEFFVRLL